MARRSMTRSAKRLGLTAGLTYSQQPIHPRLGDCLVIDVFPARWGPATIIRRDLREATFMPPTALHYHQYGQARVA